MTTLTAIGDLNSSEIARVAAMYNITHARFIAEGGEDERHISIWGLTGPDGLEFRVARTNGGVVWEEDDLGDFADLMASIHA